MYITPPPLPLPLPYATPATDHADACNYLHSLYIFRAVKFMEGSWSENSAPLLAKEQDIMYGFDQKCHIQFNPSRPESIV